MEDHKASSTPSVVTAELASAYGRAYQHYSSSKTLCAEEQDEKNMYCGIWLNPGGGKNIIVDGVSESAIPHSFFKFNPTDHHLNFVVPDGTVIPQPGQRVPDSADPTKSFLEFRFSVDQDPYTDPELAKPRVPTLNVILHGQGKTRVITSVETQKTIWEPLQDKHQTSTEAENALLKMLKFSASNQMPEIASEEAPQVLQSPDWSLSLA
ncbi:hypothetical protein [Rhodoligotrophos ferricapiens]|uniref:hypothetical protein n=1 Tax=Rhodoligotrophos ferricapiens TaxID=3069264 RepID=UPI00315C9F81